MCRLLGKRFLAEVATIGIGIIGILVWAFVLIMALLGDVDYIRFEESRAPTSRISRVKKNGCHEGYRPCARVPRHKTNGDKAGGN